MSFIEAWRNGQTVRKHTMENIRAENVAEHTWGLIMLLMVAWPNAPSRFLFAAQIHDSGERATGDMPGPTKWANPELGALMDEAERRHMDDTLPKHLCRWLDSMTETDWAVVEFFDRAEFCVSMSRERRLGNTYAMLYFDRSFAKMEATFLDHEDDFYAKDPELLTGCKSLVKELQNERHKLLHLGEYDGR
jgi:5'-deoxynucleotidase YfbR-like HD superfamily hydrolase